jgi:hypothetical protein
MLVVNSFPRTGNRFLIFCIERYLDLASLPKTPAKLHDVDLMKNKEVNQIVIFRNPKDTIISFSILKVLLNNKNTSLDVCIDEFIKWNKEFARNIDHLYPLTFEQVTKHTFKSLDCVAKTLEINKNDNKKIVDLYNILKSKDGGWNSPKSVQQSSKLDPEYLEILKEYESLSPLVIAELYDIEIYVRRLIKKRQNELGWNLPN